MPRRRELQFEWLSFNHAAVLTVSDDPHGDPLVAQEGTWIAVGPVRLDNRAELERWAGGEAKELTDLGVVLRVVARHGTRYIPRLLGDFAFVVWDSTTRTAVAATDAFAVQRLYHVEQSGLFAFSSRAEVLALEERYDLRYLLELVAMQPLSPELSVYAGVRSVPAGSMAVLQRSAITARRYWSVADFEQEPAWARPEHEAVESCRQLLTESVRLRLGRNGETWAQLSGGLDSSSVVSIAQWLAKQGQIGHGLSGTVTFVDRQGSAADERNYSRVVVDQWQVHNETIVDSQTWQDDSHAPPRTDQPRLDFAFYPRDQRMSATVRAGGGRVLLTGWGGDEVFGGNMLFFADWLAQGRLLSAVREMTRRSAIGRVSFWELAYKNALLPFLPRVLLQRLVNDDHPVQPWLKWETLRRYEVAQGSPTVPGYAGRLGHKYRHAVASMIARLVGASNRDALADSLDVRHPFLYRPLVEFALRLPPELRARPYAHRWVLREAMRGILPDVVRMRVGKPETGAVLAWSLTTQRARLAPLLRKPILAELGVLDAGRLRAAFEVALCRTGRRECMHAPILSTLGVEAWLQMRSGRWPPGGHLSSTESMLQD